MNPKIGNLNQISTCYRFKALGGKGDGQEMVLMNNGVLTLLVNLSKAADIHQCLLEGKNVSFLTRNGLVAYDPDFLHRFPGGMVYTCGLDAIGGVEGHELHGLFHSIPAEVVSLKQNEEGIVLETKVEDSMMFGHRVIVYRTLTLKTGEAKFTLQDRLVNEGYEEQPYALLYHCNFGYPFLDEDSKILTEETEAIARTPFAEHEFDKRHEMESPVPSIEETCYFLKTKDGSISLTSPSLNKKATVKSNLPNFVEWKCRRSGDYVVGLEPCTSYLDDRLVYQTLQPGESKNYQLKISFETMEETKC